MDSTPPPGLTETLANLSVTWILIIVAGLTILRLSLIRVPTPAARGWCEILESGLIAIVLVFLIIRPFIVQAYFIPSPSMEPTLIGDNGTGDRILVNKFAYRIHNPRYNDVVVFLAPAAAMAGNPDFIKRLIGLPGDRIQVIGGRITINGNIYYHYDVRRALAIAGYMGDPGKEWAEEEDLNYDPQAHYHVKFVDNGVQLYNNHGQSQLITKSQLSTVLTGVPNYKVIIQPGEVIRNGHVTSEPFIAEDPDYDMTIYDGEPLKHDFNPQDGPPYRGAVDGQEQTISQAQYQAEASQPTQPIPPGYYLMMGDNRNDSNDSTNWGLLKKWRIVGQAQFIFWPLDRIGLIRH
jgi:signal peptidase I